MILNEKKSVIKDETKRKPFVSLVVPGYNEAAIIEENLTALCSYMESLKDRYDWELIFVNDGSKDNTEELAIAFAEKNPKVTVLSHHINFNLGQALRYAFSHCHGDYIVTMDVDLSYSPDHIERLLDTIIKTKAKIVIASPYMPGGKVSYVPWLRRTLSREANRFLSLTAKGKIYTLTGMVRAYDRQFINYLNLKAMDMEINPEIIYKAQLLRALIVEIPAHLNWSLQKAKGKVRQSSMRLARGILSGIMSGFIFRPYIFFFVPGIVLSLVSLYIIAWIFINTVRVYPEITVYGKYFDDHFSAAVAAIFRERPYAFFIGGVSLIVSFQFISLGFLSLQNKRYYEELFHLNSRILKNVIEQNDITDKLNTPM
jgi:glycosyltransferase involved in cell wall biosynthesis